MIENGEHFKPINSLSPLINLILPIFGFWFSLEFNCKLTCVHLFVKLHQLSSTNKSLHSQQLKKSNFLLSSLCGRKSKPWLNWVLCVASHEIAIKVSVWLCSHKRLYQQRTQFAAHSEYCHNSRACSWVTERPSSLQAPNQSAVSATTAARTSWLWGLPQRGKALSSQQRERLEKVGQQEGVYLM